MDKLTLQLFKKLEERITTAEGIVGPQGPKGDTGAQGSVGPKGPTGPQGPKGPQGPHGRDGVSGSAGPAGPAGRDGTDGTDGVSVVDASIDFDGYLRLSLSDGSEIEAGKVAIDPETAQIIYNAGGGVPDKYKDDLAQVIEDLNNHIGSTDEHPVFTPAEPGFVPAPGSPPQDRVLDANGDWSWRGFFKQWVPGNTYYPQNVVFEGGWLTVANTETTDYPAPEVVGDPTYTLPDTPAFNTFFNTGVVFSGHLYTFTKTGYFRALRVWVPELTPTTNYRFVLVRNPNGANPVYSTIEEPVLTQDGWTILGVDTVLVLEGEELLVYIDALNSGSDVSPGGTPADWVRAVSSNTALPVAGEWNTNVQQTLLRINELTADAALIDLTGVIPGSTFKFTDINDPNTSITFLAQSGETLAGGVYSWTVAISSTGTNGAPATGTRTLTEIVVPVAAPTSFVGIDAYWDATTLPSWATIQSFLQFDGVTQPVQGDEAYGIDIAFQELTKSDDWDVFGLPVGSGGGGGGRTGVATEVFRASSFVDQDPVGLGTPLQLTLGPAQTGGEWFEVDALGTITCVKSGTFQFRLKLVTGREGAAGESQIYSRLLINGTQAGDSLHTIVDNARIEIPVFVDGQVTLSAGDLVTIEIARDTDGNDSGGVRAGNPDLIGWNPSPSASIIFTTDV